MLSETTSPSSSSPSSPPYYVLSSDTEPSDPQSPTLAQLQARALASQHPSQLEPEPEVASPPPEQQNPTTFEQPQTPPPAQQPNPPPEQPIPSPSEPQLNPQHEQTTPSPSAIPPPQTFVAIITPILNTNDTNQTPPSSPASNFEPETAFPFLEEAMTVFAEWMTSEAFKLKGLSEQVRNDFIRDDGIRLQARLAREAEEKARTEAEEKARLEEEQRIREVEEKVDAEAAAADAAEAKAKDDAEEAARITEEEAAKARADALTQGGQSNSESSPLDSPSNSSTMSASKDTIYAFQQQVATATEFAKYPSPPLQGTNDQFQVTSPSIPPP
ncbi:eukaryotic translation initiation factor 4 gamma-like [Lathyrus oleraceus]|uniref:eukaryotic translation initiation factor 4 gamma-like n=1 Tax=Pisum sativum TaxID=3888 RepID=UPI0021D1B100|nr:eukaryotic translation initiation factor 4 gamma-like [Pisum sativum]